MSHQWEYCYHSNHNIMMMLVCSILNLRMLDILEGEGGRGQGREGSGEGGVRGGRGQGREGSGEGGVRGGRGVKGGRGVRGGR